MAIETNGHRGGQPGNQNARKSRIFEQAFLRELKRRDIEVGDGETLRMIVAKIIDQALAGDIASFKEARDTVDGKPAQSVTVAGDGDSPLETRVTVKYERPEGK